MDISLRKRKKYLSLIKLNRNNLTKITGAR